MEAYCKWTCSSKTCHKILLLYGDLFWKHYAWMSYLTVMLTSDSCQKLCLGLLQCHCRSRHFLDGDIGHVTGNDMMETLCVFVEIQDAGILPWILHKRPAQRGLVEAHYYFRWDVKCNTCILLYGLEVTYISWTLIMYISSTGQAHYSSICLYSMFMKKLLSTCVYTARDEARQAQSAHQESGDTSSSQTHKPHIRVPHL